MMWIVYYAAPSECTYRASLASLAGNSFRTFEVFLTQRLPRSSERSAFDFCRKGVFRMWLGAIGVAGRMPVSAARRVNKRQAFSFNSCVCSHVKHFYIGTVCGSTRSTYRPICSVIFGCFFIYAIDENASDSATQLFTTVYNANACQINVSIINS